MVETMLVVLIVVAVIAAVSSFLAIRSQRSAGREGEGQAARELADLMVKIDAASAQQVKSTLQLTETFGRSQADLAQSISDRLAKVETEMNKNLSTSSRETAESLAGLRERLKTIDKAQDNIKALSEQMVTLQHILDDNPARGAFGEVQLNDLVKSMLPASAYKMQAKLVNGKKVDCLIYLPDPPGPIAVDAKFPLKAYQEMKSSHDERERERAAKQLAIDTKKHIRDIAEKYVDQEIGDGGSTAQNALMFIPSEAVYGELYANHPGVIEESQRHKVYLVAPTTLMATLTTIRAVLRDVEMQKQASVIQIEVGKLLKDVHRLDTRVSSLDKHFDQASRDIDEIKISSKKIVGRGESIESLELVERETISQGEPLPALELVEDSEDDATSSSALDDGVL